MPEVDEVLVAHYVRQPERLTQAEQQQVSHWLEVSAEARVMERFFRGLYQELAHIEDVDGEKLDRFLDGLFPPARIIPLKSYRSPVPAETIRYTTVLAAATSPAMETHFVTLATLAAEAERVIVRVVYRRHDRACRLYLLTDDLDRYRHAIVHFPDFDFEFVTDSEGIVLFTLTEEQIRYNWHAARALLRVSCGSLELDKTRLSAEPVTYPFDTVYALRCWTAEGRLFLQVTPGDRQPPVTRVLVQASDTQVLLDLAENQGFLEMETLPDLFTLRFYA